MFGSHLVDRGLPTDAFEAQLNAYLEARDSAGGT